MARHNREGHGVDQRDVAYEVGYQPDWLHQVKVTRTLETGRQSTKTLFRNPGYREQNPGGKVRTRIASRALQLEFEITVDDPRGVVSRIIVETVLPDGGGDGEVISFSIDGQLLTEAEAERGLD